MKNKKHSIDSFEGVEPKIKPAIACPISGERLDERAVRMVATITVILLIAYFFFGCPWIPAFLLFDFSMRGIFSRKCSPLGIFARKITSLLDSNKKKMINAGPKIFAARLGVAFSAILLLLQVFGLKASLTSNTIVIMFAGAAFLEAAFAVCLGCYIYHFIQKIKPQKRTFYGDGI